MLDPMISLDIVIVNWNAGQQLRDCLGSIFATNRDGFELIRVVVVDNASSDGSANDLTDIALPLVVINNTENLGFAKACNQGAVGSRAEYLLFLNPDTRLFNRSLSRPLEFMAQKIRKNIGIVGIQLVDNTGKVSQTCARFPTPRGFFSYIFGLDLLAPYFFLSHHMSEWDHMESRQVDHVLGAFFLVRRSLHQALGGFDEHFFMYFEDLDFSCRAKQAGWSSYYLSEAQVYHRGGGSSEQVKSKRLYYSLRSRILYGYKHLSWWAATGLMLGTMLLEPFLRIGCAMGKGRISLQETLRGYALLWMSLPQWITKSREIRLEK